MVSQENSPLVKWDLPIYIIYKKKFKKGGGDFPYTKTHLNILVFLTTVNLAKAAFLKYNCFFSKGVQVFLGIGLSI